MKTYKIPEWADTERVMAIAVKQFLAMPEEQADEMVSAYQKSMHCLAGSIRGEIYKTLVRCIKDVPDSILLFGIRQSKTGNKRWMEIRLCTPDSTVHQLMVSSDGQYYSLHDNTRKERL